MNNDVYKIVNVIILDSTSTEADTQSTPTNSNLRGQLMCHERRQHHRKKNSKSNTLTPVKYLESIK